MRTPQSRYAPTVAPLPNASSRATGLKGLLKALAKRSADIRQFAAGDAAIERPVVPENLHGAARDQRQAAQRAHPPLFQGAYRACDRIRDSPGRPAAGQPRDQLEHVRLGGILTTQDIAGSDISPLQRRAM